MGFRFIHAADIHLGYHQYNSDDRYNDFARAFGLMADEAIRRQVDVVLIAGDLFHKRVIQPRTLLQATHYLERLNDAGIRIVAIQGNHDRAYRQEGFSWLDFIEQAGLWTLLSHDYVDGVISLRPWQRPDEGGAYLDITAPDLGTVRIIGLRYSGASTPRVVADTVRAFERASLPPATYTILAMHAGLEGVLDGYSGGLSHAQLEPLHPYVDYLALGHIHKPFEHDGWIHNPGSLETNSTAEAVWERRGFYCVEVDPNMPGGHVVERIVGRRRPFVRLEVKVDACAQPEDLLAAIEARLPAREPRQSEMRPVVELRLTGVLAFGRTELDLSSLQEMTALAYDALLCNVKDTTVPADFELTADANLSREDLERLVIQHLVENVTSRQNQSQQWTEMVRRLKRLSLSGSSSDEIISELRAFRSELIAAEEDD